MIDYLTGSIWFHSVLIGALLPPAFVRVVANRAANSSGQFVSDWEGFIRFVAGALIAVIIVFPLVEWIVSSIFSSAAPEVSMNAANVGALIIEVLFYHRFVLGRKIL